MVEKTIESLEQFDRVRIRDDAELEVFRGLEGTVGYIGASGIAVAIEGIPVMVPMKWSELEKVSWDDYGEED